MVSDNWGHHSVCVCVFQNEEHRVLGAMLDSPRPPKVEKARYVLITS